MGFGRPGPRTLLAADADGDKSVTRAELEALAAEEFAYRDRNGDGVLDLADQSPTAQRLAAARPAKARGEEDGPPRRRRADTDEDGRLSREEHLAAEARIFSRLDADADGVITRDELDAHAEARAERGHWRRAH